MVENGYVNINDYFPKNVQSREIENSLFDFFDAEMEKLTFHDDPIKVLILCSMAAYTQSNDFYNKVGMVQNLKKSGGDTVHLFEEERPEIVTFIKQNGFNVLSTSDSSYRYNSLNFFHLKQYTRLSYFCNVIRFNAQLLKNIILNLSRLKFVHSLQKKALYWIGVGRYFHDEDEPLLKCVSSNGFSVSFHRNPFQEATPGDWLTYIQLQWRFVSEYKKTIIWLEKKLGELFKVDLSGQFLIFIKPKMISDHFVQSIPSMLLLNHILRATDKDRLTHVLFRNGGNAAIYYAAALSRKHPIVMHHMVHSFEAREISCNPTFRNGYQLVPSQLSKKVLDRCYPHNQETIINIGKPFYKTVIEQFRERKAEKETYFRVLIAPSNDIGCAEDYRRIGEIISTFQTCGDNRFRYTIKIKYDGAMEIDRLPDMVKVLMGQNIVSVSSEKINEAMLKADLVCIMASPEFGYITSVFFETIVVGIPTFVYLDGYHKYKNYIEEMNDLSVPGKVELSKLTSVENFENFYDELVHATQRLQKLIYNNDDTCRLLIRVLQDSEKRSNYHLKKSQQ